MPLTWLPVKAAGVVHRSDSSESCMGVWSCLVIQGQLCPCMTVQQCLPAQQCAVNSLASMHAAIKAPQHGGCALEHGGIAVEVTSR